MLQAFPKKTHKSPRLSRAYQEEKQRDKVRAEVLLRCRGRCEASHRVVEHLELHECHKRSLTVHQPTDLRFNSRWCLLLSREMHQRITDGILWTFFADIEKGANGLVVYIESRTQEDAMRMAMAMRMSARWFTAREVWEFYKQTR